MNDQIEPTWMQGFEPQPAPVSNAWAPGMKSPKPNGRPRGIVDKRQKLQSAFADDAVAITKVVIDKALAGDMVAASNALARIAPPLRARAERVQFTLTDGTPLSAQARQILQAVAEGRLDAGTAKVLIGCIQAVSGIRAVEDLESRPALLEARAVN